MNQKTHQNILLKTMENAGDICVAYQNLVIARILHSL